MRVGLVPERRAAPTEHLGLRGQLNVNFQADRRSHDSPPSAVKRTFAEDRSSASLQLGPMSCSPIGRPAAPFPAGNEMAGTPARSAGIVNTSALYLSLIHISEPTRLGMISYA